VATHIKLNLTLIVRKKAMNSIIESIVITRRNNIIICQKVLRAFFNKAFGR